MDVDTRLLVHRQNDAVEHLCLEAGRLDGNRIAGWGQTGKAVVPGRITCGIRHHTGSDIGSRDFGPGNCGSSRVGYRAVEVCIGLCPTWKRRQTTHQERQQDI